MADVRKRLEKAAREAREAPQRRDALIVEASEAGMPRREVARLTGLSNGRIQQIVDRHRASAR